MFFKLTPPFKRLPTTYSKLKYYTGCACAGIIYGVKYKAVTDMDIHFINKKNLEDHKHHKLSASQVSVQPGGLNINTGICIISSICVKALTVIDCLRNVRPVGQSVHPKLICRAE